MKISAGVAEILTDVTKTADAGILQNVLIRDGVVYASDSKRAVRFMWTEEERGNVDPDGLYRVAKAGRDYHLVPTPEKGAVEDYPEGVAGVFGTSTSNLGERYEINGIWEEPDTLMGLVLVTYGNLQKDKDIDNIFIVNPLFLTKVCRGLRKIATDAAGRTPTVAGISMLYHGINRPLRLHLVRGNLEVNYAVAPYGATQRG